MTVTTLEIPSDSDRERPRTRHSPPVPHSSLHATLSSARREFVLVRGNAVPGPRELRQEAAVLKSLMRRWVRISVLWDERLLAHPALVEYVLWQARAGIQVRTAPQVPVTMALVDDSTSAVFVDQGEDAAHGTQTVSFSRCPDTVDVLHYLFLGLWEEAAPLVVENWAPPEDDQSQEVLRMLARGLTDEQIAHRLDVSKRTVSRTVAKLMRELNARSRFEAGAQASRLGWFGAADSPE
ncbi:helix-turn-helix transcriptional regulator [Streptomyces physcomitrii]|uniref:Helix-turn-helix transcriptional regulator n=1 Tax=Streptomyces physcomitrii TaxID=2724184 RepID=A0ABX1H474_9ACTN|nr:helix-turn-helix transcriptional regulator [Streptomyces physcomitrii]NKI43168.1 helix-turn-helix transcriptional regulator [Streptomyces physcomitrii]